MKRCPTCDKTYEDSLRFCQSDGTPLVDAEEELDPFKTMVARPEDIKAAMGPTSEEPVLDLPEEPDPNKTQFVSEEELRAEMGRADDNIVEIPPASEADTRDPSTGAAPDQFSVTSPPIPSPFDAKPTPIDRVDPAAEAMPSFEPPASPFSEPEPPASPFAEPEPAYNPFGNEPAAEPMARAEWTPPAAPEASWQDQGVGSNTPFQPPPPAVAGDGQNKTLPIVSLVAGVLSLCCWISPLTGIVALVTGYLAMKNIKNDPSTYGGKGLALAGMIVGGLFLLLGLAYWIFIIFFNGMAMMMQGM